MDESEVVRTRFIKASVADDDDDKHVIGHVIVILLLRFYSKRFLQ